MLRPFLPFLSPSISLSHSHSHSYSLSHCLSQFLSHSLSLYICVYIFSSALSKTMPLQRRRRLNFETPWSFHLTHSNAPARRSRKGRTEAAVPPRLLNSEDASLFAVPLRKKIWLVSREGRYRKRNTQGARFLYFTKRFLSLAQVVYCVAAALEEKSLQGQKIFP
jgi:hypothetical protein